MMSIHPTPPTRMEDRFPVRMIRNFPFSGFCSEENILEAIDFIPREGDVILCMYPLVLSSWIINCLWKLFRLSTENHECNFLHNCLVPSLESVGTKQLYDGAEPRILRCNLPYSLTNINPAAKYIYITRNPKDILVSYYLIALKYGGWQPSLDNFFAHFLEGRLPYGDFFVHVRSWYENKKDNILFLNYENMHVNPKENILKIAKFLGPRHHKACLDSWMLEQILHFPCYDYKLLTVEGDWLLKCVSELRHKHSELKESIYTHVHQGLVHVHDTGYIGIWKRYLSLGQSQVINNMIAKEFQKELYRTLGDIKLHDMMYM